MAKRHAWTFWGEGALQNGKEYFTQTALLGICQRTDTYLGLLDGMGRHHQEQKIANSVGSPPGSDELGRSTVRVLEDSVSNNT